MMQGWSLSDLFLIKNKLKLDFDIRTTMPSSESSFEQVQFFSESLQKKE